MKDNPDARIEKELEIMIEESLPNQSLRDSLHRTDDNIRGFLGIMKDVFNVE